MNRFRIVFAISAFLLSAGVLPGQTFSAASAPELDQLFQRTNGWVGADGAYSIPLARNKTLWLFSDTWVGKVEDNRRIDVKMINNSIAIQKHGKVPEFYYPTNKNGEAQSFIKPEDGRGFYWLFHGTRTREGLFFFLKQVEIVDNTSVFGFRGFSTSMAHIRNPDDHPSKWRITQTKFPFDKREGKNQVVLGSAVMKDKGFVYIYGNHSGPEPEKKGTILARVPERRYSQFEAWEFYSNGTWSKDFDAVTPICVDGPAEAAVLYWPALKKYVYIYTQLIWGKMVLRTADKPTGPWSEPIHLYDAPEMKYPPERKVFAYAGKAHPQLSTRKDELIATYAANSFDVWQVFKEARLYWPRFVRIQLEKTTSQKTATDK